MEAWKLLILCIAFIRGEDVKPPAEIPWATRLALRQWCLHEEITSPNEYTLTSAGYCYDLQGDLQTLRNNYDYFRNTPYLRDCPPRWLELNLPGLAAAAEMYQREASYLEAQIELLPWQADLIQPRLELAKNRHILYSCAGTLVDPYWYRSTTFRRQALQTLYGMLSPRDYALAILP